MKRVLLLAIVAALLCAPTGTATLLASSTPGGHPGHLHHAGHASHAEAAAHATGIPGVEFLFSPEVGSRPAAVGMTPDHASWDSVAEYEVRFECPPAAESDAGNVDEPACPAYLLDSEDVMSQPMLVVDPTDPYTLAFHALHGGPGVTAPGEQPPPAPHARADAIHQPHTVWRSTDSGEFWYDNRYYAPSSLSGRTDDPLTPPAYDVYGMDNAITRDHRGDITIASTYARRAADSTGPFQYMVALWALGDAGNNFDYEQGYVIRHTIGANHTIDDLSLVYDKKSKTVVTTWLESDAGGNGMVRVLTRHIDSNTWKEFPSTEAVRGCSQISNAIFVDGDIYVGCFAGLDFDAQRYDANATEAGIDALQMFRIDPETGEPTYLTEMAISRPGNAVLASAENIQEGAMLIASAGVVQGEPFMYVTFGMHGDRWTEVQNYGRLVTGRDLSEGASRTVVDARATAAVMTQNSGMAYVIYSEQYEPQDGTDREFHKSLVGVYYTGQYQGHWGLGVGDPAAQANVPVHVRGLDGSVYRDEHDSLVLHQTKSGRERMFIAYGDHGFVRYGEFVEDAPLAVAFPLAAAPPPIPAPLLAANPALVGAAAGVLSTAMVARMAAAKKKTTAEAPSL